MLFGVRSVSFDRHVESGDSYPGQDAGRFRVPENSVLLSLGRRPAPSVTLAPPSCPPFPQVRSRRGVPRARSSAQGVQGSSTLGRLWRARTKVR